MGGFQEKSLSMANQAFMEAKELVRRGGGLEVRRVKGRKNYEG
jgi:hypothetical protein